MGQHWTVISPHQADQLEELGIKEAAEKIWSGHIERDTCHLELHGKGLGHPNVNAYNLSEIAVMLGYTFVKSNVKEAADQLIHELKVGSSTAKDCNARLKETKQQSF